MEIKNVIGIIQSKKGNILPLAVTLSLAILIIACGIYEYLRLMIIAQGVRDGVQSAVISVVTANYDDAYSALREGYSGGYTLSGDSWIEQLDEGDVYGRLDSLLGLRNEGGYHTKYTGNTIEYRISDLNVSITNTLFAPSEYANVDQLLADTAVNLEVPFSFGWQRLPPMKINLKCKAGYVPKF